MDYFGSEVQYKFNLEDRAFEILGQKMFIKRPMTTYETLLDNIFVEFSKRGQSRGLESKWKTQIVKLNERDYTIIISINNEVVYQKIKGFEIKDEYTISNELHKLVYFDITTFGLSSISNYVKEKHKDEVVRKWDDTKFYTAE